MNNGRPANARGTATFCAATWPTLTRSKSEHMWAETEEASRLWPRFFFAASLLAAIGFPLAYAYIAYDFSSDVIPLVAKHLGGPFAVLSVLGFFLNKRRFSIELMSMILAFSVIAFALIDGYSFFQALEFKKANQLISAARTPAARLEVLQKHKNNRAISFIYDLLQTQNFPDLRPPESQLLLPFTETSCPAHASSLTIHEYENCAVFYQQQIEKTQTYIFALKGYYDERDRVLKRIFPQLVTQYHFEKSRLVDHIIRQNEEAFFKKRQLFEDRASSLLGYNEAMYSLFEFLKTHIAQAYPKDGRIAFKDATLDGQYRQLGKTAKKTGDTFAALLPAVISFK